jgi:hypothetical protein
MKVVVTVEELFNKGVWIEACNMLGLNDWAVAEGLMGYKDELTLTEEQARTLGVIKQPLYDDD